MNNRKLLIIKLVLLVTILSLVLWFCLNSNLSFPFGFKTSSSEIETVTQDYTAINKFNINLTEENVKFEYYDGNTIKLTYVGEDGDILKINQQAATLDISKPAAWNINFGNKSGELVILLPKDTTNYTYDIHLVSGKIQLTTSGIRGDFTTVSGDLDINGDFTSLDFDTVSGDINSVGIAAEIDVKTVSGTTSMVLAENCELDGESVSGSFYIKVLGDAYEIKFDTISGKLNNSFNINHHPQHSIDVNTISGDLNITK